jgi:hypothetical protein
MFVSNAPLIRPLFSSKWWRGEYGAGSKPRSAGYPGGSQGHIELESQKEASAHFYSVSGKKHDDDSSSTEHMVLSPGQREIRIQTQIDVESK